jgi:hypothetical protein
MPPSVTIPDGADPALVLRLQRMMERALSRAAWGLHVPGVSVTLAAERRGRSSVGGNRERPREPSDPERMSTGGDRYRVPSFDDGGVLVEQPLRRPGDTAGTQAFTFEPLEFPQHWDALVFGDDVVMRRPFPKAMVARLQASKFLYAGGESYVRVANLARAFQWGYALYGGVGFAILQPHGAGKDGPFIVAGMLEPLNREDLPVNYVDEQTGRMEHPGHLTSPPGYTTVVLITRQKQPIYGSERGAPWPLMRIEDALNDAAKRSAPVEAEEELQATTLLSIGARQRGGDEGERALYARMDRTMFAAMAWDERARILELMIAGDLDDTRRIAVMEIIMASGSTSELEAVFARLRERNLYERLFREFDGEVYALLRALGEFRPAEPLDWSYLAKLLLKGDEVSSLDDLAPDKLGKLVLDKLTQLWDGLKSWLLGMAEGVESLLTEPEKIVEGLGHLAELIWTVQLAQAGDPKAREVVTQMVRQAGATVATALRGLRYAEELGTPFGEKRGGTRVGSYILGKLQAMLILEVLSWFIGIGEIKAPIRRKKSMYFLRGRPKSFLIS